MKKIKNICVKIYFGSLDWRTRVLAVPSKWLIKHRVNADMITWFRLVLTIPIFLIIGTNPLLALILLFINIMLDSVDGVVARISKTASIRGRTLDVTIDHFFVIPIVLGLVLYNQVSAFWASFYLVNILINHFCKYSLFGIEAGKYPFSISKYFIYAALAISVVFKIFIYDFILVFWAIYLLIENLFLILDLYYGRKYSA